MKEHFPDLAEKWKDDQITKDGYIIVKHPMTNEELIIGLFDDKEVQNEKV